MHGSGRRDGRRAAALRWPSIVTGMALAAAVCACGGGGGSGPPPNPLFVSPAGSDDSFGDALEPLRTISHAAQIARDGYSIVVAPGTYEEAVTTDREGAPAAMLQFIADGVAGTGNEVVIRAPVGALSVAFKLNNSPGTVVDGFVITAGGGGGIVVNGSDDIVIQNCIVRNNRGDQGDGIRLQDSARALVFNNLVHGNSNAGIAVVGDPGSPNAMLLNNTVALNDRFGVLVGRTDAASPRAVVRNNILFQNGLGSNPSRNLQVREDPPSTLGFEGDFNLVFPASYVPGRIEGINDINRDPLFASLSPASVSDFRLRPGSPAIDAGTAVAESLRECLRRASATVNNALDSGVPDLGYHAPQTTLRCVTVPPSAR